MPETADAGLPAADAGPLAIDATVDGVYRSRRADHEVTRSPTGEVQVRMTFTPAGAMPALDEVDACPDFLAADLPEVVLQAHGDDASALALADEEIWLTIDGDTFTRTSVLDFGGLHRCTLRQVAEVTRTGNTFRTDADHLLVIEQHGGEVDLVAVYTYFDAPPGAPPVEDLFDVIDDFDWILGDWQMLENPGERLGIHPTTHELVHESVRQVGVAGDPDLPYPTICHVRYTAADADLTWRDTDSHHSELRLEAEVTTIELMDDRDNGAACGRHVEQERAGRERILWTLDPSPDGDLWVSGHRYRPVAP